MVISDLHLSFWIMPLISFYPMAGMLHFVTEGLFEKNQGGGNECLNLRLN